MIELHVWQVVALVVLLGVLMAGALYGWGQAIIWRRHYRRLLADYIRMTEHRKA